MSRITTALLDLTINVGCKIIIEMNPAGSILNPHVAITMSNHGVNLRVNISREDWDEDRVCKALEHLLKRLELEAKAVNFKG